MQTQRALEEELSAYLGLDRDEYLPWGRLPELPRSGSDQRELITPHGSMADLRVSNLRRGNGDLNGQNLTRYERCWEPRLDPHVMGYGLGLSLRDLQEMITRWPAPRSRTQTLRQAKRARKQAVLALTSWVGEGKSAAEIESRAQRFAMIGKGRELEAVSHFGVNFHQLLADLSVDLVSSVVP